MADKTIGKITQIIGAVLDIKFAEASFRILTQLLGLLKLMVMS